MTTPKKCSRHPQYTGVNRPRKSKNFPDGCKGCWDYYGARKHVAELEATNKAKPPSRERVLRAASGLKQFNPSKLKVVKDEISDQLEIMYGRTCFHVSPTRDDVDTYIAGLTKGLHFDASIGQDTE